MQDEKGRLIVFEGLDGAGTSTQLARLQRWLSSRGVAVEVTKEPSSGPLGAMVRLAIETRLELDPKTLALAFAADRVDHIENQINGVRKALDNGRWVLCDRYVLSSLAYQGEEVDSEWLLAINRFALEPDVTIFVDTDAENCLQRIRQRSSSAELYDNYEQLTKVMRNYRRVVAQRQFVGHLITVNGNEAEESVFEALLEQFQEWLTKFVSQTRMPLSPSDLILPENL
jgi:dTMP kinase